MTETPSIQPKTLKSIAWWKAGLVGMVVSTVSVVVYLILGNWTEWFGADTSGVIEWLLIVALIVPTIIYTILFTARNSDAPNSRLATIAVSIMTVTPPTSVFYYIILEFVAIFSGPSERWDWEDTQETIIFFVTVYAVTTIFASVAWLFFGRKNN
jgi:hypothetical protein